MLTILKFKNDSRHKPECKYKVNSFKCDNICWNFKVNNLLTKWDHLSHGRGLQRYQQQQQQQPRVICQRLYQRLILTYLQSGCQPSFTFWTCHDGRHIGFDKYFVNGYLSKMTWKQQQLISVSATVYSWFLFCDITKFDCVKKKNLLYSIVVVMKVMQWRYKVWLCSKGGGIGATKNKEKKACLDLWIHDLFTEFLSATIVHGQTMLWCYIAQLSQFFLSAQ